MAVHTLRDVFRHGLGDIYDAEQQILTVLDQMEMETESPEVRDRLRLHRQETRHQIENLERCFELLGSEPPRVACAVVRGLRDEKLGFQQEETPSPAALEVYNLEAMSRAEHHGIATYRGLVGQARALGNDDIRRLLEQNLGQEEAMAAWAESQRPHFLEALAVPR